jgi:hypothetical protein
MTEQADKPMHKPNTPNKAARAGAQGRFIMTFSI